MPSPVVSSLANVRTLLTLGPSLSSHHTAATRLRHPESALPVVALLDSFAKAADAMPLDGSGLLLSSIGCNPLGEIQLLDLVPVAEFALRELIIADLEVVLASRTGRFPRTISTHPATVGLLPPGIVSSLTLATTDFRAGFDCLAGRVEGALLSADAAADLGLTTIRSFGLLPLGFGLHTLRRAPL